jgi:hypothetical protein
MGDNVEDQIVKAVTEARDRIETMLDSATQDNESDDDAAVRAQREGRTNAVRDMAAGRGPAPGRWDSIGEGGEGLDELQGLYAADVSKREHLAASGPGAPSSPPGPSPASEKPLTGPLWDRVLALVGERIETPKGEPFAVLAAKRGISVTVSPLDGGQKWDIPARELETAWSIVRSGQTLDGLTSIRLQEAGLGSRHPEYVAGLLHAIADESEGGVSSRSV